MSYTDSRALSRFSGLVPPAWAISGLPPPLPPTTVLAKKVSIDKPAALRDLADKFRDRIESGIVVLGAAAGPKALLIAVVTKDLTDRFHAGNIVKQLAAVIGGSGGGRPDMAQAGGTQPEKLDEALEHAKSFVKGV